MLSWAHIACCRGCATHCLSNACETVVFADLCNVNEHALIAAMALVMANTAKCKTLCDIVRVQQLHAFNNDVTSYMHAADRVVGALHAVDHSRL